MTTDAEALIAELVTAVTAKDATAITMTAVALGRLLERLGQETVSEALPEISPAPGPRRPRRVDIAPGRPVQQTQPGAADGGRSMAELQQEFRDGKRRTSVIPQDAA